MCPPVVPEGRDYTHHALRRDGTIAVHWRARQSLGAWERVTYISLDGIEPADPIDMMAALEQQEQR